MSPKAGLKARTSLQQVLLIPRTGACRRPTRAGIRAEETRRVSGRPRPAANAAARPGCRRLTSPPILTTCEASLNRRPALRDEREMSSETYSSLESIRDARPRSARGPPRRVRSMQVCSFQPFATSACAANRVENQSRPRSRGASAGVAACSTEPGIDSAEETVVELKRRGIVRSGGCREPRTRHETWEKLHVAGRSSLVVVHVDPDELRFVAPDFVRQFRCVWDRVIEMNLRTVPKPTLLSNPSRMTGENSNRFKRVGALRLAATVAPSTEALVRPRVRLPSTLPETAPEHAPRVVPRRASMRRS